MRVCSVYLRDDEIFVVSAAKTKPGFEIHRQPVFRLCEDESDIAIGEAVLKALASYRENVPAPGLDSRSPDAVLQSLGARSWRQVERSSRNVLITDESGEISAVPTRRPPDGGYVHLNGFAVHCRARPDEVGAAVRGAALLCG